MNTAMRFALRISGGFGEDGLIFGQDNQKSIDLGLVEQLAQVERSLLIEALQRCEGRSGEAAESLKLARKTFYDKLNRHGIKPEAFRGLLCGFSHS